MAAHFSPLIHTVIGGGGDVSRTGVLTSSLSTLPPCSYLFAFAVARVFNSDLTISLSFSVLHSHLVLLRLCQHGEQVLSCSGHVSIP